jgi:transmembrane sensor
MKREFAKPDNSSGLPSDPDSAAAYWIARRELGLTDSREERAFQAWLAISDHAQAYASALEAVAAAGSLAAHPEIADMRQAALTMRPAPRPNWHWSWWAAAVASIAALVFAIAIISPIRPVETARVEGGVASTVAAISPASITPDALIPTPLVYSTGKGQHRTLALDDGSAVTLDTATTVQVAFGANRRSVALLQGQAFFHVAKDKARPFVVEVGDRRVTAVGTAFDVRVDRGRVRVALIEGRVNVDPLKPKGLARWVPSLARETLDAGQELVTSADGTMSVSVTDVERMVQWQQDQLIFRDDTVEGAVAELNRYSNQPIVIGDPRVAALRVSGVFRSDRQENFLAALAAYYPIGISRNPAGAIVLTWQQRSHNE